MKNASPQLVGTRTDLLELLLQVLGVVVLEDVLGHPAVTDTLQTAFFLKITPYQTVLRIRIIQIRLQHFVYSYQDPAKITYFFFS